VAARRADARSSRPSPRPRPGSDRTRTGSSLMRIEQQPAGQLVATAGSAIVTAARVGRILGRSGWRIAKQLPGVTLVEQQAQRLRQAAGAELLRLLEMPQQFLGAPSAEEQRVMMLVQDADTDPAPLRTAMTELLSRAGESTPVKSREYLFGTIVSQLVPDEARILAALAEGKRFAAVDVVAKHVGRSATRTVFANASLIGAAAGVAPARSVATHLTRLQGLGLVEFGPDSDELSEEYDQLAVDGAVQEARSYIDHNKLGSAKLLRKSVALSPLGREFWSACAPDRATLSRPWG
jgi:DNA-binding transcriptional ArsR family regulator